MSLSKLKSGRTNRKTELPLSPSPGSVFNVVVPRGDVKTWSCPVAPPKLPFPPPSNSKLDETFTKWWNNQSSFQVKLGCFGYVLNPWHRLPVFVYMFNDGVLRIPPLRDLRKIHKLPSNLAKPSGAWSKISSGSLTLEKLPKIEIKRDDGTRVMMPVYDCRYAQDKVYCSGDKQEDKEPWREINGDWKDC